MPDCWLDLPLGSLGWFQAHTSTDELRISPRPGPLPVSASLQSSTVISPALKPESQASSLTTHPSCLPALHPPPPISGQIHHCFLLRSLSNPPTLLHSNHQGSTKDVHCWKATSRAITSGLFYKNTYQLIAFPFWSFQAIFQPEARVILLRCKSNHAVPLHNCS